MEMVERDYCFRCLHNMVVCNHEDLFFQASGIPGFGGLNLFS